MDEAIARLPVLDGFDGMASREPRLEQVVPVSEVPTAMPGRITIRNPFTSPGNAADEPDTAESLEIATLNGQVVVTPFRSRRADAVRAKLAELNLTARDVRDAVKWARETIATARTNANRAPDGAAASRTRSTPPRVVVDTELVLAALVSSGGSPADLRREWQRRRFTPLASKAMADELMGGLARPGFRLTTDEQEDLLFDYLLFCEIVEVPIPSPSIPGGRNPFDVPSFALAVAGGASCLVADDRELPGLRGELPFPIVGADDFLARLPPD